jgi:GT2 family glycosyltransferase
MARVTIAFPTFRASPRHFEEALEAALAQTYRDIEVLVVDDGESDEALRLAARSGRVRIVRNERRRGLAGNWNRCVELARTELLNIAHQDDRMEPSFIASAVEVLDRHPRVGLVHTGWLEIDDEGRAGPPWAHLARDHAADFVLPGAAYIPRLMDGPALICCPTVVFRREVFDAVGLFDERFRNAADVEFWFRALVRYDVGYLAAPLFRYRKHAAATTFAHTAAFRYAEQLFAKRLGLGHARAAGIYAPEELRRLAHAVALDAAKCARRVGRDDPAFVFRELGHALRLSPKILFSRYTAKAVLRAIGAGLRRALGAPPAVQLARA